MHPIETRVYRVEKMLVFLVPWTHEQKRVGGFGKQCARHRRSLNRMLRSVLASSHNDSSHANEDVWNHPAPVSMTSVPFRCYAEHTDTQTLAPKHSSTMVRGSQGLCCTSVAAKRFVNRAESCPHLAHRPMRRCSQAPGDGTTGPRHATTPQRVPATEKLQQ
jgi:hypothetical protein